MMIKLNLKMVKEKVDEFNKTVSKRKQIDFYRFLDHSYTNPCMRIRHNILVGNGFRILTFDVGSYSHWIFELEKEEIFRGTLDECLSMLKKIKLK